jgi:hypothetical protein
MSADLKNPELNEIYNMSNIIEKIQKIALLITVCSGATACGKKSTKDTVIEPPQRSGTSFVSYSLKYTDQKPALNADGTKLVFISGRDSAEDNAVLKAYKLSWAVGQAPDTSAARVTASDLGRETFAAISPNGDWIALTIATTTSETSIYVQDFAGAGEPRLVTKTSDAVTNLSFSPDSKLLMWINKSQSEVRVKIADIGAGLADPISEIASPAAVKFAANVTWIPGVNYSIAVAESTGDGASAIVINRFTFAAVADANTAVAEAMVTSELYNKSFGLVANIDNISFVSKVARSSKILVPRFGKVEDPQPTIPLANQPQWFVPGAAATVVKTDVPYSYDTFAVALGTDTLFTLNKTYYYCEGDERAAYGSDFVSVNLADKSTARMVPRLNATGDGFDMASDLCDNMDGTVRRRMDDRMTEIALSSSSSAASFRMAYVTRISTKFDAACVLKLGDPDIYLVDNTAGVKKIYHLAGNQVPLENDARGDAAACNL